MTERDDSAGVRLARRPLRWLIVTVGAAHAALAALQHRMNPDGVNYLDLGDAFTRGDWEMAINPVWSPLYALLLGSVNSAFDPSPRWEFPLVHVVGFVIFLFALMAFETFWHELTLTRISRHSGAGESPWSGFSPVAWECTGYGLFIFCTLRMIKLRTVTPDLLMFGLTLLACSVILRIRRDGPTTRRCLAVGGLLGLAYLSKSVMFPLSFLFLFVCAVPWSHRSIGVKGAATALAALLAIAGPWIVLLSFAQGAPTFGEAGQITYAKYATSVPYPHWQGEGPYGTPRHPSRLVHAETGVYEFAAPIAGTYAISYNPTYWYDGLDAGFDPQRQLQVIAHSGFLLFDLLLRKLGVLFLVAGLFYLSARRPWFGLATRPEWVLIVPSLVAMGMYSIVLVEERYLAVFTLLLSCGVLCGMPPPPRGVSRFSVRAVWLMVTLLWINVAAFNARMVTEAAGATRFAKSAPVTEATIDANCSGGPPVRSWRIAQALRRAGIEPGGTVAFIGDSGRAAFWSRLARTRIIAEIIPDDADRFWFSDGDRRASALAAFAAQGVSAVVAERPRPGANLGGFEALGGTPLLVHLVETSEDGNDTGVTFATLD